MLLTNLIYCYNSSMQSQYSFDTEKFLKNLSLKDKKRFLNQRPKKFFNQRAKKSSLFEDQKRFLNKK